MLILKEKKFVAVAPPSVYWTGGMSVVALTSVIVEKEASVVVE